MAWASTLARVDKNRTTPSRGLKPTRTLEVRAVFTVGISPAANLIGAMMLAEQMGHDATVVTVLPDSNKKYLSTSLCQAEAPRDDYMTPPIKLDRSTAVR